MAMLSTLPDSLSSSLIGKHFCSHDPCELEPWIVDMHHYLTASSLLDKEQLFLSSSILPTNALEAWSASNRPARTSNASWRGFKNLIRKQFMPFDSRKDASEDSQFRKKRQVGKQNSGKRSANLSRSTTKLVELRKLDAKIQDGFNKSAFHCRNNESRLQDLQPNHKRNFEMLTRKEGNSGPSTSSVDAETGFRKKARNKENLKVKVVTLFSRKASNVALEACDALKLE